LLFLRLLLALRMLQRRHSGDHDRFINFSLTGKIIILYHLTKLITPDSVGLMVALRRIAMREEENTAEEHGKVLSGNWTTSRAWVSQQLVVAIAKSSTTWS
jgi:hypothetical protein